MRRSGIALVAGLLVMAALGLLTATSLFAVTLSLRQAGHAHAHAVAEAGAVAGLELGIGLLLDAAGSQGRMPPAFDLPVIDGFDYRQASYHVFDDAGATLTVEARAGPAVVRAEALLVIDADIGPRVASRR